MCCSLPAGHINRKWSRYRSRSVVDGTASGDQTQGGDWTLHNMPGQVELDDDVVAGDDDDSSRPVPWSRESTTRSTADWITSQYCASLCHWRRRKGRCAMVEVTQLPVGNRDCHWLLSIAHPFARDQKNQSTQRVCQTDDATVDQGSPN